jgi:threonine/homoserine/homoserine lactone efflux protein
MPTINTLTTFLLAALLLAITPGPSMLHVVTSSVRQGRRGGIFSALGSFAGRVVHTVAVALGLSALLLAVPYAFEVIKLVGAVYLIYLGIKTIIRKEATEAEVLLKPQALITTFYQGILTNLINPKVAIFFLAFLPQFIDPARGSVSWQIIVLGFMLNFTNTLVYIVIALLSGSISKWLRGRRTISSLQRWFAGGIYIVFGTTLALTERT